MTRSSQMIEHYAGRNADPSRELFSAVLGLAADVRRLVFAGLTADVADELAERVAQQVSTVVRAAAPQPPRGPAHGSGRPRCTGFECHHASMRLSGFLVRHY